MPGAGVVGAEGGGGMGVSEAEVLELTQRWSELCDREAFNLLALERAVHEVKNRRKSISMWSDNGLYVALVTLLSCGRVALCSCYSILAHFFVFCFLCSLQMQKPYVYMP